MRVKLGGQTNHRATAIGRIHLVRRKNKKVNVLLRGFTQHGKFSVCHNLRAVHDDLRAIFVSQSGNAVDIGDVSGDIGGCCDRYILNLVLLEQIFYILILHPTLTVDLSIDHLAAFSPRKVVGMMLHTGTEHNVIFTCN